MTKAMTTSRYIIETHLISSNHYIVLVKAKLTAICNWLATSIVYYIPETGVQDEEIRKLDELIAKSNGMVNDLTSQDFESFPTLTIVVRNYQKEWRRGENTKYLLDRLSKMDAKKKYPSFMMTYPDKEAFLLPPPNKNFPKTNLVRDLGVDLKENFVKLAEHLISS